MMMMMPADQLAEYYPRGPAESKKIRDYAERCYEELDRSKAFLQSKASFLEFMKQVNDEILKVPSKRPEILPNLTIIGPPAPPAPPAHPVVEDSKLPLSSQNSLARLRELRESFEHSLPRKTSAAPPSSSRRQQSFETVQFAHHPPPSRSSSSPLRERRRKETSHPQTMSDTPPSSQPYNPSPAHDPVIRNSDIQRKNEVLDEKKVVFSPRSDHTLDLPNTPPPIHPSKQDQRYASDQIANPAIHQRDNTKDIAVVKEEVREDKREEKEEIEEFEEEDEDEDEVEEEENREEEDEEEYAVVEPVKPSGFHEFTPSVHDLMKADQETRTMASSPVASTLREIETQQPTFPRTVRADEDEVLVRRDPLSTSFSSSLYPLPYQSVPYDSYPLERTKEEWERSLFNEERRERILKEIDQTAAKKNSNYSYHPPSIAPSQKPPPYSEPQSKSDAYPAIHIHNHVTPSPPTFPNSEVNLSELKMSGERESNHRVTSLRQANTISFEGSDGFSSSYPRLRFALRGSNPPSESVDLSSLSLKRIRELNGLD